MIYLVWADKRQGDKGSDVWLTRSSNYGDNWTTPLRINADAKGHHHYLPWMTIDQTTGNIYIVYYDRSAYDDTQTDVYLAYSTDTGSSFKTVKISDSTFTATPVDGAVIRTFIAAHKGIVTPVWTRTDNGKAGRRDDRCRWRHIGKVISNLAILFVYVTGLAIRSFNGCGFMLQGVVSAAISCKAFTNVSVRLRARYAVAVIDNVKRHAGNAQLTHLFFSQCHLLAHQCTVVSGEHDLFVPSEHIHIKRRWQSVLILEMFDTDHASILILDLDAEHALVSMTNPKNSRLVALQNISAGFIEPFQPMLHRKSFSVVLHEPDAIVGANEIVSRLVFNFQNLPHAFHLRKFLEAFACKYEHPSVVTDQHFPFVLLCRP